MLKEAYPDLKANQSFLQLSAQIEGTENRLSVERKRYNDAVRSLNPYARTFIGRMFCSWAGVEQADYFESTPRKRTSACFHEFLTLPIC